MSWWSTTLWTARTTWRRRPRRSLKTGFITSLGFFLNLDVICWGDIGWHQSSFLFTFNVWDNIKDMWVGGRRHFGRREQPVKEDQGGQWIHGCITSSLKKIPTELIHPNVSDLPGLHWVHQLPLLVTEKKSPLATDDSNHHLYYLFLFWGDLFSQNVTLQLLILLRLIDILQLCCPITDF